MRGFLKHKKRVQWLFKAANANVCTLSFSAFSFFLCLSVFFSESVMAPAAMCSSSLAASAASSSSSSTRPSTCSLKTVSCKTQEHILDKPQLTLIIDQQQMSPLLPCLLCWKPAAAQFFLRLFVSWPPHHELLVVRPDLTERNQRGRYNK